MKLREKIENAVIRQKLSHRGGGIEIDLGVFTDAWNGEKMTAYQNYLGGGMLGKICNDCTILGWEFTRTTKYELSVIAEELSKYMHELTNHDDEWECETYEDNQNKAVSAY
tara:strand:- start:615 stop:947 length:333 start_codon:yes stop_codon:yes gene_type:complete